MTPHLEAAIAAIQPLNHIERQQLLQFLIEDPQFSDQQSDLQTLSVQFWQGASIEQLRAVQMPSIFRRQDSVTDFWPTEDTDEEFLAFLRQQRQDDTKLKPDESFAN